MTRFFKARFLFLTFATGLVLSLWAAQKSETPTVKTSAFTAGTNAATTETPAIEPGLDDPRLAFVTASLLQQMHYSHLPFDQNVSSQFFDRYLESLDPRHMHFLQSDLDEFERYRTNLNVLTLERRRADVTPAFEIFARFEERLKQRVAYVDDLLKNETFTFDSNDRIEVSRHDSPYPKDMDEARKLWRQQLLYEYLQEKLGLEDPTKKASMNTASADAMHKQIDLQEKPEDLKKTSTNTLSPEAMRKQIVDTVSHRLHRTLRMFTDWNHEDVMGYYLTALAHVYDPHSDYFNAEQLGNFAMTMNLSLFGIGAQLFSDDGYCKIQTLLPGGPAAKSKQIKENDRIIAVAQSNQPPVDVVDMNLNKVVQMIRGPKGTQVRLTVTSGTDMSTRKVVSLIRDKIPLEDQAAKGKIIDLDNGSGSTTRLGVIDLPSFYAPMDLGSGLADQSGKSGGGEYTSVDVAKLLTKFKRENVSGVILDLRRNGGGSLEEAIRVTGLFIKSGPVVQVRAPDSDGRLRVQVDEDKDSSVAYDGPLIVLTSRFSASASEIVAGALQDYGRGLIVGDCSTHGKGTVQTMADLKRWMRLDAGDTNEPGALKVTMAKFYRPSGASTQKLGVMPDVVLPSVLNYSTDVGEKALENPMEWDTIPSAKFDKLNLVQPYLGELLKRSTERVATNQDFSYVRQDIDEYRKQQDDKTVSLNETQRLQEMKDRDARQKGRDKEILSRKESTAKVYEISLKQADLPGLPAPKTNTLAVTSVTVTVPGDGKTHTGNTTAPKNSGNSTVTASGDTSETPDNSLTSTDDTDEPKAAPVDADMDETQRILVDYIGLLPKGGSLLATQAETHLLK